MLHSRTPLTFLINEADLTDSRIFVLYVYLFSSYFFRFPFLFIFCYLLHSISLSVINENLYGGKRLGFLFVLKL